MYFSLGDDWVEDEELKSWYLYGSTGAVLSFEDDFDDCLKACLKDCFDEDPVPMPRPSYATPRSCGEGCASCRGVEGR